MKHQIVQCPCCKAERDAVEETPLLAVEEDLRQHDATPWWAKGEGWSIHEASRGELQWACRYCLKSKRATPAQPWEQQFCDHCPYFAYFDELRECKDCGESYVFSAHEQHFWYEVRKFWVQSRPKQCVDCRRKRRERANAERLRQQKQNEQEQT